LGTALLCAIHDTIIENILFENDDSANDKHQEINEPT
jgi:hypothetical protein